MEPVKRTEPSNEVRSRAEETGDNQWPALPHPIAPWWHTAFLVLLLLTVSVSSAIHSQSLPKGFAESHIRRYLFTIGWELLLAALAWWGIRMRHVPARQLLGARAGGVRAWARDFGVAMIFWLMAMIALGAVVSLLRLLHLSTMEKSVVQLAPRGALEILLWLVMCITAGVVEEFVFRGYFLQQFASIGLPSNARVWIGILGSSLLFGLSHGYEGLGGMIAITAYGAMFCILCIKTKSLRPAMIAHAWHDSIAGIAISIARHLHAI